MSNHRTREEQIAALAGRAGAMADHPMLAHPCLSDLKIGKAVYTTRLHGDGRGNYVGATREAVSGCAIAHVGRLVVRDGERVLELTGYLTVPKRAEDTGENNNG